MLAVISCRNTRHRQGSLNDRAVPGLKTLPPQRDQPVLYIVNVRPTHPKNRPVQLLDEVAMGAPAQKLHGAEGHYRQTP